MSGNQGAKASPPEGRRGRPRNDEPRPDRLLEARDLPEQVDPITGLCCGESFRRRAARGLAEAAAHGNVVSFAVIDADDFSELNEVFGEERADRFLAAFAARVAELAPEHRLGRLAGDVFLLCLDGVEPEEAFVRMEALRSSFAERPLTTGRGRYYRKQPVTLSVGLAGFPAHGSSFKAVLGHALAALRRAKRLGKNRVGLPPAEAMGTKTSHYTKTQLGALRELAIEAGLREAELLREALEDLLLKYKSP